MNIEAQFPSAYIKAADLQGRTAVVKIATVRMEKVGDDQKPILYFVGRDRGLVMNKTNKNAVVGLYGAETDEWTGKAIELFVALVDYQGKQTEAIRVRSPRNQPDAAPSRPPVDQRMYDDNDAAPPF